MIGDVFEGAVSQPIAAIRCFVATGRFAPRQGAVVVDDVFEVAFVSHESVVLPAKGIGRLPIVLAVFPVS